MPPFSTKCLTFYVTLILDPLLSGTHQKERDKARQVVEPVCNPVLGPNQRVVHLLLAALAGPCETNCRQIEKHTPYLHSTQQRLLLVFYAI